MKSEKIFQNLNLNHNNFVVPHQKFRWFAQDQDRERDGDDGGDAAVPDLLIVRVGILIGALAQHKRVQAALKLRKETGGAENANF